MPSGGETTVLKMNESRTVVLLPHADPILISLTSNPRYTAAKHLLTELKATLSDLQEQMESSDRIAHQSEVSERS